MRRCATAARRAEYRGCGRGSRCARWSAHRCARNARPRSAPRRRFPSAIAAPPRPRLAENRSRQPSPAARPALISLRSSVLSRSRLKSCNSTLADCADGHLNYTAALRCGSTRKSTTSVDANNSNPWVPRKEGNAFRDCPFTNKAGLKILVQRSWTDRHDCLAASLGTMYLICEGRQRGATRLHGSCFINELCREISYVRDPCFVSRRTFSLADAQISHRCLGTEERCAAISHGSRCCPHDRAPAAFRTGEH